MKKQAYPWVTLFCGLMLVSMACSLQNLIPKDLIPDLAQSTPTESPTASHALSPTLVPVQGDTLAGVQVITGEFNYTNEFYPEEYAYEHAVALIDMTGFVLRDTQYEVSVDSQVLAYADMDLEANSGAYRLQLPIRPAGSMNDVDQNVTQDTGLQIFAIEYAPNWLGGPFYAGDDLYKGWPSYLASVNTDSENENEVTGGKLIVWAPDDQQQLPSGFGDDQLLFTADDPLMTLPAGWSVVDMDQDPFAILRQAVEDVTLYEPADVAIKDFSAESYTEAFNHMFEQIRLEYAFNGIPGKAPDWDALYAELYPRIEQAEQDADPMAFYLALRDYTLAFKDGHVGLDGGDLSSQYNGDNITGGFGFAVRELIGGAVIAVYVGADTPAADAGMQVGAEIIEIDGVPVTDAIGQVSPFTPQSTAYGLRYEQTVFLTRGPVGVTRQVSFKNPGSTSLQSADLTSIFEMDSLYANYLNGYYNLQTADDLPVEFRILDSNIAYVKINSNSDDLNLAYRLFERAMKSFEAYSAGYAPLEGLIIDMRLNFGGSPLGLAGYLTDQTIPIGQLEYFSSATGQFEPEGDPDEITPMSQQYSFSKMLLLVDQFCYSACEIEAYAFSQVPGMIVAGQFPTGGVEAETARGSFKLPEGIELGVPTGRFVLPDGSIFLEGVGVVPTEFITIDEAMVLATDDAVLSAAEQILLNAN